jgi:hypothetical protein
MRRTLLTTCLLACTAATAAHALAPPVHHPVAAERVAPGMPPLVAAPVLIHATPRLSQEPDHGATVVVTGTAFELGVSVTMSNPFYVFTFGPQSLERVTPTSLQFDGKDLPDGTYDLSVRSRSGQQSSVLSVTVKRK